MSNNKGEVQENVGSLIISEEVVASIALNAVKNTTGLAGFTQKGYDVQSLLKPGDSALKSVKVRMNENEVSLKIYISVKEGFKIQEVTEKIQESAKNAVQSMTGKVVGSVDVTVSDIELEKSEE
ncbi:MAG: Asp23/Gls24 family envelope stress response protein [Clostridia bacterium]|nr:Asp23/Gls24 family envelope stress response protein [Clostridia bacterium]